jgi:branched-chain amino acid transport system permease protein
MSQSVTPLLAHGAEILVLTLTRGSLYALIAVGFALVFGTGRILNLFHGGFFLLGAYAAFFLARLPLPGPAPLRQSVLTLLAAALVGAFGLGYYWGFLRRYLARPIHLMVVGLVSNLLAALVFRALRGTQAAYVPPIVGGMLRIGSAQVLGQEAVIVVAAALVFSALAWMLRSARTGAAIRAVAEDAKGASLVGIRPDAVLGTTVALAALLAGLAGALAAPVRVVTPDIWTFALLKSFTVVILGGIGSLRGTLLTAYALGAVEIAGVSLFGEAQAEFLAVLFALAALVVRPRGVLHERAS